jgi:hypothetical protein
MGRESVGDARRRSPSQSNSARKFGGGYIGLANRARLRPSFLPPPPRLFAHLHVFIIQVFVVVHIYTTRSTDASPFLTKNGTTIFVS